MNDHRISNASVKFTDRTIVTEALEMRLTDMKTQSPPILVCISFLRKMLALTSFLFYINSLFFIFQVTIVMWKTDLQDGNQVLRQNHTIQLTTVTNKAAGIVDQTTGDFSENCTCIFL